MDNFNIVSQAIEKYIQPQQWVSIIFRKGVFDGNKLKMLSYPYPRDYKLWYPKSLWTLCLPHTHNHTNCHATNKQKIHPLSTPLTLFLSMYVLFCGCSMCVAAQPLVRDAYCIGGMKMMEISTIATCTGSSEHIPKSSQRQSRSLQCQS